MRFRIKVQARARRQELAGVHAGALRVRVTAPPLDDRANHSVLRLLAEYLRVPRSSIKIAGGARAPQKLIAVAGLDRATVLERLGFGSAGRPSGEGGPE
ncbi:MAG: DUF167 domain-containing protein [Terriglobia bacterium]